MNIKEKIGYVLGGILIALFGFFSFALYQINKTTDANTSDIQAIVDFINKSVEANKAATPAPIETKK